MKRHGNLFERIVDIENIKLAHKQARRGKAFYSEVKMVDADIEHYAREIQKMLVNQTFTTSQYEMQERFDGRKMRTIYKLPYYPDRIVQHALLNVAGPVLTNSLIRDTYQSITGRGTSDAMRRVKQLVRSEKCPKYALKIDVAKFYPSVDNVIMKQIIRRKIKCLKTLWLIDDILDSMPGLPIGNYTSQILGNVYLSQFDWQVKQHLRPAGYFRYCDDIVFMSDSTSELMSMKNWAEKELASLKLSIKPSWNIYNIAKQGVDFVGYVFKPSTTRLRRSIKESFANACKGLTCLPPTTRNLSRVMAYKGWAKSCNGKHLWRKHTHQIRTKYPSQIRSAL